jgi:lipopolysaccharide biosynthesis regulator YciM
MINVETFSVIFWFFLLSTAAYLFYKSYKQGDEDETNYFELALRTMVEGNNRGAIDYLKEAIRRDTSNVLAYIYLGNLLRDEGALNQAVKVHKDLTLRADVSNAERYQIHLALSKDLIALKKEDLAIQHLQKVLSLQPNDAFASEELVRIYEKKNDFLSAFTILKNGSKDDSKRTKKMSMYKVLEGLTKADESREKEARILFKEALKIYPKNEAAYILIGDSYQRENRLDDAIERWLKCANDIPEKAHFVFDRLEKGWFENGEFFKLEDFYRNLTQKKKKNPQAVIALAEILSKKGETDNAIAECKAFLEAEPANDLVHAYYLTLLVSGKTSKSANQEITQFLSDKFLNKLELFTCASCGNQADEPLAKCPTCSDWGAYS